jgi:16S rRNA G966 N2-methylase RsmD
VAFIRKTASALGVDKVVRVLHQNVFDFLEICARRFDIVFADPPYALEGLDTLPDRVLSKGLVHAGGYFILEHPAEYNFAAHPSFVKEKKYGNVHFSYFSPVSEEES